LILFRIYQIIIIRYNYCIFSGKCILISRISEFSHHNFWIINISACRHNFTFGDTISLLFRQQQRSQSFWGILAADGYLIVKVYILAQQTHW